MPGGQFPAKRNTLRRTLVNGEQNVAKRETTSQHGRRTRWLISVVAAVAVVLGGMVAYFALANGEPSSPEEVLDAYIVGLNEMDADALSRLAHRDVDASSQIQERLAKLGGQAIHVTKVEIKRTGLGNDNAEVSVSGQGDRGAYHEDLVFSADEFGVWYVNWGVD